MQKQVGCSDSYSRLAHGTGSSAFPKTNGSSQKATHHQNHRTLSVAADPPRDMYTLPHFLHTLLLIALQDFDLTHTIEANRISQIMLPQRQQRFSLALGGGPLPRFCGNVSTRWLTTRIKSPQEQRVFHVLPESEPFSEYHGGAFSRWVANISRFDDSLVVVAPEADDTWGIPEARLRVVPKLIQYKNASWHPPHRLPWSRCKYFLCQTLGEALNDLHAGDVVWIHNRPDYASSLSAFVRERSASLVLHLHNSHLVRFPRIITEPFDADCYVFASTFIKEEAFELLPKSALTAVIHNGADPNIFYPAASKPNQTCTVLCVGRIVPEKGLHVFLEAMRTLEARSVPIRGLVVSAAGFGQDKISRYSQEMIKIAPQSVRFLGYHVGPSLGKIYRDSDLFCLPSIWQEPFGMVAVEAMASGLPLVASRAGGIPEILANGGGLLVEPNSIENLVAALGTLSDDAIGRHSMGMVAYEAFKKRFTWEIIFRNYRQLLNVLTAGRTKP